ncbi:unnamed protein product [Bursaphelenchus okinawaensis]|uniref:alpha-1,2-Mannosidase n=1 Tax=Bursaphelenchus okinawaensis TaxID=465554 RepID=A0A811LPS4_9BILA|nr:unnamed protein product [Bursaphelenchus okinawaensis]CAG9127694.1 unnamed protein product [Bursaphelenchus okinawaensis]
MLNPADNQSALNTEFLAQLFAQNGDMNQLLMQLKNINQKYFRIMLNYLLCTYTVILVVLLNGVFVRSDGEDAEILNHKEDLKNQAKEMFMHAYTAYKTHAFMADEIMPISCKPRIRGKTRSRGDVDDSLGNFSLTLVDSLDTLAVLNELDEFEEAAAAIIRDVRFDSDWTISVFETNIRMVGGLISGHLMSKIIQDKDPKRMLWYSDQLLKMAADLADRLLPAFNSTSGVPYSKINLKRGLSPELKHQSDTCTACAGTIILEWAALSRLTGNPIYEQKSRKAMDFLWNQRNHGSNLMGTVLNVHSGDWIRRDAGIGAGIDSYYEYTLKAYILLGEEDYLHRFNTHYESVMKYLNRGPLFVDVHMHRPTIAARSYMDALLAFWPGVQVLKGDLKGAIEMHEMLYQVIRKHKFLPEAFTHDLQIYWAQHPLRPEFLESTYLLYRATKDPHYLEVAKSVMDSMNQHVRVKCGFSALKDVRSMELLDEMESFVLAETFKYLYMIFAEPGDLLFDPDNYVLTTEAHFLPLAIGETRSIDSLPRRMLIDPDEVIGDDTSKKYQSACPNFASEFRTADELSLYGKTLRTNVKKLLSEVTNLGSLSSLMSGNNLYSSLSEEEIQKKAGDRLRAWAFSTTNADHLAQLKRMGIQIQVLPDGKMQLSHTAQDKKSAADIVSWQSIMDYRAVFGVATFWDLQNDPIFVQSKQALASMSVVLLLILITWVSLVLGGCCIMIVTMILTKLRHIGGKSGAKEVDDEENEEFEGENVEIDWRDREKLRENRENDGFGGKNSDFGAKNKGKARETREKERNSKRKGDRIEGNNTSKNDKSKAWGSEKGNIKGGEDRDRDEYKGEWLLNRPRRADDAASAVEGVEFIQEMIEFSKQMEKHVPIRIEPLVQLISDPIFGREAFKASSAQFGTNLEEEDVIAEVVFAEPNLACTSLTNIEELQGKIAVVRRGECMFQEKARHAQDAGAVGVIVIDNQRGTSADKSPQFAMSADDKRTDDIKIPSIFLFDYESQKLMNRMRAEPRLLVRMSTELLNPRFLFTEFLKGNCCKRSPLVVQNKILTVDYKAGLLRVDYWFKQLEDDVEMKETDEEEILDEQTELFKLATKFQDKPDSIRFNALLRNIGHQILHKNKEITLGQADIRSLKRLIKSVKLQKISNNVLRLKNRTLRTVICKAEVKNGPICEEIFKN